MCCARDIEALLLELETTTEASKYQYVYRREIVEFSALSRLDGRRNGRWTDRQTDGRAISRWTDARSAVFNPVSFGNRMSSPSAA